MTGKSLLILPDSEAFVQYRAKGKLPLPVASVFGFLAQIDNISKGGAACYLSKAHLPNMHVPVNVMGVGAVLQGRIRNEGCLIFICPVTSIPLFAQ